MTHYRLEKSSNLENFTNLPIRRSLRCVNQHRFVIVNEAKEVFDDLGFAGCNRKERFGSATTNDSDQFNKSHLDIFRLELVN